MIWKPLSAAVPEPVAGGPLPPCPGSPNCVCSEDDTPDARRVAPLPAGPDHAASWGKLKKAVADLGGDVRSDTGTLLHAVFKTPVLRFPDDLHARLDEATGLIHLRSQSRVGRSDLGANRTRVEKLRAQYEAAG